MQRAGVASLPANEHVLHLIWPFVPVVLTLALFCIASVDVLSAARSFVAGESLWTKGQKAAVLHLLSYSRSQLDSDYDAYLVAIAVPLGDHRARIELERRPDYDHARAVEGLLIGGNHSDDIAGMVRLYRNFREVAEIDEAIGIWAAADVDIIRLDALARQLRERFRAGGCDAHCVAPIQREIVEIDSRLTPQEAAFSSALGKASRRVRGLLASSSIALAVMLLAWVTWVSRRMMAKERRLRAALSASEERLQLAVAGSSDGLWDWHPHRGELYFSPRCAEMLGYGANELPHARETLLALMHPDDVPELGRRLSGHLREGMPYDIELRLRRKGGGYLWMRARGRMVRSAVGKAMRMAGSLSDISDRKRFEAQLFAEKERAQVTLQAIGEAVITTDVWGRIESLNPVAESMTGWSEAEAAGCFLPQVCPLTDEATREAINDLVPSALAGKWPSQTVTVLSRRTPGDSAATVVVKPSVALIRDKAGQAIGVVVVLHDVSLERAHAAQLAYEASHDPLTGLVNRLEFERRLGSAIVRAQQEGCAHTLMYLDLDRFKAVNDTCGHAAGDELLCQIADIMRQQLRRSDTLARLGGDEFAVLLEYCAAADGERVAEALRNAVAAFRYTCRGHTFSVGVSVGLVKLDERTGKLEEALATADVACYRAKRAGRNRVEIS
ncbi:diguanylate cyclase [Cupriavidus sp. BIS7]|uniref:diguanylate cyclase domain-containing protein n=1 Tax=Cupriavidus sp. BIS7 TaxID=1217718 RepID=UPI0002EDF86B|nr:diguanylate cyclase [Cupriavidus sp. BIS7]